MIKRHSFAVFAACAFWMTAGAAGALEGFRIDQSKQALAPEVMASLNAQLDVVASAGLPPQVLDAMKGTTIVVDPDLRGNPGMFAVRDGIGAVYVRPIVFASNRPILLHELLHAYHFKVLGMKRPEIQQEYQRVKNANLFPARFQGAHFLENHKEFFAVTATLYLFGDIQQPPFSCAALSKLDAAYLAFLGAQFGPNKCPALAQRGEQNEPVRPSAQIGPINTADGALR